ncbi:choice-of-anchor B family protein [Aquimarina sediminis]|uniref:choice-of-anchor B family protein n=1 Tax=Aquimarina sediminis TaxID=2070536 RepID=UPI000C9FFD4D|nr:choice-of-anchor B family protein [Aquimarina sediminis]
MKNFKITLLLITTAVFSYGQTPCQNGLAGSYPCNDYDLMSHISLSVMNASTGNDSWGWTDPQNGKEYAIIGLNNGTAFIDASNPTNPIYLGKVPTATSNSTWRDVKVYKNHAFIVSEASGHGMQVFDLTRLRNVTNPPQTFTPDTRYTEFGNAHNIVINEDSGYAYVVGAQRNSGPYKGGPLFINIQDPKNPINAGGFLSVGQRAYTHDAQVITYNGPDADYTGKEILIGSNEIEIVIADITNKSNPTTISTIKYSDVKYTHQGWFTEDMKYFILGDELDEQGVGFNTRTVIFDFQDLDNPKFHFNYYGPTPATDHNGYVKGNLFYLANYRAGIRVIDISNIAAKSITEIGSFDTYPSSNSVTMDGVWNVYPYFNSGNIVISDIQGGFFLVRKSSPAVCQATVPTGVTPSNIGGNAATISWTAVPNATYDLRYRQTGTSTWTTTTVNGASYTITSLTANTSYEAQVRSKCQDGTTSNYSGSTNFTTTDIQLNYCNSNGNSVADEYISNVSLGTINNTTGASTGGYADYTSISTDLTIGNPQTITITPTWTNNIYNEAYSVWIDYNRDGDFVDSGEQVWTKTASKTTPVSGGFTIPSGTAEGATRMRVSMKYNAIPTPCESFQYGEVEDYTINITTGGGGNPGCSSGISSFPYNEGFENTLGLWTQSSTDNIDWTIDANGTPSRNTGPSSAAQGSYYAYVEASAPLGHPNKQAILNSPCIDLTNQTSATFSFAYHMYGATDMGSFTLEASTNDGTSWTSIWNKTGNQGNLWKTANVNLSSYVGSSLKLRFNRTTGSTWQADIAIDNLTITTSASRSETISSIEETTFYIFPNPVKGDLLSVFIDGIEKNADFEIKNFIGQVVAKGTVTNTINVSNLKTGTYFIQIAANDQTYTKRFVKN